MAGEYYMKTTDFLDWIKAMYEDSLDCDGHGDVDWVMARVQKEVLRWKPILDENGSL